MAGTHSDGSAGDANYAIIGQSYVNFRLPEPAIEKQILLALGDAETVLNVGAGAGSYEPRDRRVTAVEPSETMRAQRPAHLVRAVDASSEALPFPDNTFDASMATFTVHQWSDLVAGLLEMRRVTKGPVVILTCDPSLVQSFWLNDFAPDVMATEARRYPTFEKIRSVLGANLSVAPVAIPLHCCDGFSEAYYGRPEMLLDPGARKANSAWSFVSESVAFGYVRQLSEQLKSGEWDRKFGNLRSLPEYSGSLFLLSASGL